MKNKVCVIVFLATVAFTGCKSEVEPIRYGKDVCDHCKMLTMDPKFGAELITPKGKIYKFDDINCLVTFMTESGSAVTDASEIYVIDYLQPQTLIPAKSAFYVHSINIKSPMASGIAAFSTNESRYDQQQTLQGEELSWEQVNLKFK